MNLLYILMPEISRTISWRTALGMMGLAARANSIGPHFSDLLGKLKVHSLTLILSLSKSWGGKWRVMKVDPIIGECPHCERT
jgi:hypothetical protein